jgi:two-component system alkaline phosphatase synthesis response regulator PhoP
LPKRILVVDDEKDIVDFITYNLQKEGYEVLSAYNGKQALVKAQQKPDLVLLDIMLPELDGYEVCKELRSNASTASIPIIFLTARGGEVDEIVGLEVGADDYIVKPISPRRLTSRIKAMLRRAEKVAEEATSELIQVADLEISREKHIVNLAGRQIFFPRKEFEMLSLLASSPGRVFSRDELLSKIWGEDVYVVDRTIDVHVRKIREKLGDRSGYIETVKGVGYRFKVV